MKNLLKRLKRGKNERGAALITALLFLVLLTVLGMAVVMTSNTDMFISRNDAIAKKAVYVADAGAQKAMDTLDSLPTPALDPAWHNLDPISVTLPTGGTAKATISYKLQGENGDTTHKYSGAAPGSIVLYNRDYGYSSSLYRGPSDGGPVFTIKSTGTAPGGGSATVVADVAKYAYKTIPPGGVYSGGPLTLRGHKTSISSPDPNMAVYSCPAGPAITVNGEKDDDNNGGPTITGTPNYGSGAAFQNMTGGPTTQAYLGDLSTLQQMAAAKGYSYSYNAATGKWATPPGKPIGPWGSGSFDPTTGKYSGTPAVVYIDTNGTTFDLNADNKAAGSYCLFVVKGNLDISGKTGMAGLLYVTGSLTMRGTGEEDDDDDHHGTGVQWYGGIMAGGSTYIGGNTQFNYNYDVLNGLQNYFRYRVLDWQRQYQ